MTAAQDNVLIQSLNENGELRRGGYRLYSGSTAIVVVPDGERLDYKTIDALSGSLGLMWQATTPSAPLLATIAPGGKVVGS